MSFKHLKDGYVIRDGMRIAVGVVDRTTSASAKVADAVNPTGGHGLPQTGTAPPGAEGAFQLEEFYAQPPPQVPGKPSTQWWFAKLSTTWITRLTAANHMPTLKLANRLLYDGEKDGLPIKVSRALASRAGIHPNSRRVALAELETLGLIEVVYHPRRSPVVAKLLLTGPPRSPRVAHSVCDN
jgi:hypothetical protein